MKIPKQECTISISVDGGKHKAIVHKSEGDALSIMMECGSADIIFKRLYMVGQHARNILSRDSNQKP